MAKSAALEELEELIERERRSLIAGNLEAVARLAEAKDALLVRLTRGEIEREALKRLRRDLRRNNELMAAAGSGIRAALRRLRAEREGAPELTTYDRSGQVRKIGGGPGGVTRRA